MSGANQSLHLLGGNWWGLLGKVTTVPLCLRATSNSLGLLRENLDLKSISDNFPQCFFTVDVVKGCPNLPIPIGKCDSSTLTTDDPLFALPSPPMVCVLFVCLCVCEGHWCVCVWGGAPVPYGRSLTVTDWHISHWWLTASRIIGSAWNTDTHTRIYNHWKTPTHLIDPETLNTAILQLWFSSLVQNINTRWMISRLGAVGSLIIYSWIGCVG